MGTTFLYYCLPRLFGAVLFIGIVLFFLWANKQKVDELKKMAMWFVVVGLVGMLIAGLAGGNMHGMRGYYSEDGVWKHGNMMYGNETMGEMMDDVLEGSSS